MAGGPCTGLQSRPPACLDIPSVTVDALPRLVPSCEGALHAPMGLCSPSSVSGCTSHAGTPWLHRDKLQSHKSHSENVHCRLCLQKTKGQQRRYSALSSRVYVPAPLAETTTTSRAMSSAITSKATTQSSGTTPVPQSRIS